MAKLKELLGAESSSETKERLQLLMTAARAKQMLFKNDLKAKLSDDKIYNIGDVIMMEISDVHAEVSGGIGDLVNSLGNQLMFGASESVKKSVLDVIALSLGSVFGNSSGGESEKTLLLPIVENDLPISLHIYLWKYKFSTKEIVGKTDNAYCYLAAKTGMRPDLATKERLSQIANAEGADVSILVEKAANASMAMRSLSFSAVEQKLSQMIER